MKFLRFLRFGQSCRVVGLGRVKEQTAWRTIGGFAAEFFGGSTGAWRCSTARVSSKNIRYFRAHEKTDSEHIIFGVPQIWGGLWSLKEEQGQKSRWVDESPVGRVVRGL